MPSFALHHGADPLRACTIVALLSILVAGGTIYLPVNCSLRIASRASPTLLYRRWRRRGRRAEWAHEQLGGIGLRKPILVQLPCERYGPYRQSLSWAAWVLAADSPRAVRHVRRTSFLVSVALGTTNALAITHSPAEQRLPWFG